MVNWFDLVQLTNTAIKVIVSNVIGKQSDKRIIQALASSRKEFYDYSYYYKEKKDNCYIDKDNPRKEIWIDYISDTGDGWNPTYAVAYYSSNPELKLQFENKIYETKRGDILIFGGDEVYPTPSKSNYKIHLTIPFETAYGDDNPEQRPHVFALPGNHDWYDGLTSFLRLFCSDLDRRFAGWLTRQKRSYFALKLPANWWLLGSDGQLQSDIDTPQIEYFRNITEKYMKEGDRVILCISQPTWIYAHKYKKYGYPYDESDLLYLQNEILSRKKVEIKAFLAGDLHHYRRHEELNAKDPEAKVQKITSGGGGAFMHPTHGFDVTVISEDSPTTNKPLRKFILKKNFPEIKTSKKLTLLNFFFIFKNPWFGILTGFFYLLTAWMVGASIGYKKPQSIFDTFTFTAEAFKNNPFVAIWLFLIIASFIIFTDTHSRLYKWLGGLIHCCVHLISIFYIGWGAAFLSDLFLSGNDYIKFSFSGSFTFISGWIIGSFIMGIYLLISMNIFGRHDEESFSALKIQDYKNFLRIHISEEGELTIFPIKIHKVPRKWRNRRINEKDKIKSHIIPVGGSGAELIEEPIIMKSSNGKEKN